MSVIIGHASISENKSKNGAKGDQTGKEVCTRNWYRYEGGWTCLIRFRDPEMADAVAFFVEGACANNHIGYSQATRNTLLNEVRKVNFDVRKLSVDCNTDCSALVTVACIYAGIPESTLTLRGNCATTSTLQALLKSTGEVDIYTTPQYTSSPDRLKRGDILLKKGHHVVVVLKTEGNPYRLMSNLLRQGSKGESVKFLQYELNRHGANLVVDGSYGSKTKLAVLLFQKDHDLRQDGIAGSQTLGKIRELANVK